MAKQLGDHPFSGKLDNLCGYEMNGQYYLKKASKVDKKKMKKDPRYKRTLEYAALFTIASKTGAYVYRLIPREQKVHGMYNGITGQAMTMLKDGTPAEAVKQWLLEVHVTGRMKKITTPDPPEWSWNDY